MWHSEGRTVEAAGANDDDDGEETEKPWLEMGRFGGRGLDSLPPKPEGRLKCGFHLDI